MIPLDPPFRLAVPDDAPVLARLVDFAGEGLPSALWAGLAEAGEDPFEVGVRRQRAQVASGKHIIVIDEGEGPLAGLTGYPIGPAPEPVDELPAIVRPLQELENEAPETWYVNVLAAIPEARGRGFGTRLLALAERIAMADGLRRMSIIVADANAGAFRLYGRCSYREAGRRPMVKDGWTTEGTDWVLLLKDLG